MTTSDRPLPPHRRHLRPWEAVRGVLLADAVFVGAAALLGFAGGPLGGILVLAFTIPVVAVASLVAGIPAAILLARRMRGVDHDVAHLAAQAGAGALIAGLCSWLALLFAGTDSIGPSMGGLIAAVSSGAGIAAAIGWSWSASLAGRKDINLTPASSIRTPKAPQRRDSAEL